MPRRAIVLTFDRCHLGYLGCYGNEWVETPNWNRLALSSVVFDQCYGENFSPLFAPLPANHAWWNGRYQFPPGGRQPQSVQPVLADLLKQAGVHSQLLIETTGSERAAVAPAFDDVKLIRGRDGLDVPESEIPFAKLVLAAEEVLRKSPTPVPQLLWLKSRGVPLPWLPPGEFADLYFSEFDLEDLASDDAGPEAAESSESGSDDYEDDFDEDDADEPVGDKSDPDAFPSDGNGDMEDSDDATQFTDEDADAIDIRYAKALYASYVTCLDRWLGRLLSLLADRDSETLLIITAAAGSNVGERGTLEETVPTLREELIHVPLIIRVPNGDQDGSRRRAFVQSVDIAPTLLDWFGVPANPLASPGRSLLPLVEQLGTTLRDCAVMGDVEGGRALRTSEFFLALDAGSTAPRLFSKPYDRWDMQDISRDYPDTVESLTRMLEYSLEAASGDGVTG